MSKETIRVPDVGSSDPVDVIEVSVKKGDSVEAEDTIVVLESDKASVEVPCPKAGTVLELLVNCLLYTSPSPRDRTRSRMPSSA